MKSIPLSLKQQLYCRLLRINILTFLTKTLEMEKMLKMSKLGVQIPPSPQICFSRPNHSRTCFDKLCCSHAHYTLSQDEPTQPHGWAPAAFSRGPDSFQAQTLVKASGVQVVLSRMKVLNSTEGCYCTMWSFFNYNNTL